MSAPDESSYENIFVGSSLLKNNMAVLTSYALKEYAKKLNLCIFTRSLYLCLKKIRFMSLLISQH